MGTTIGLIVLGLIAAGMAFGFFKSNRAKHEAEDAPPVERPYDGSPPKIHGIYLDGCIQWAEGNALQGTYFTQGCASRGGYAEYGVKSRPGERLRFYWAVDTTTIDGRGFRVCGAGPVVMWYVGKNPKTEALPPSVPQRPRLELCESDEDKATYGDYEAVTLTNGKKGACRVTLRVVNQYNQSAQMSKTVRFSSISHCS